MKPSLPFIKSRQIALLLSILLIFCYPFLGNLFSQILPFVNRRLFQLGFLFFGLFLAFKGVNLSQLKFKSFIVQNKYLLSAVAVLAIFNLYKFFWQPGLQTLSKMFVFDFIVIFIYFYNQNSSAAKMSFSDQSKEHISYFLLFLGLIVSLAAYFLGPSEAKSYIDFGGNTINAGVSLSFLLYIYLLIPQSLLLKIVGMILFLYPFSFTTSRTSLVAFFAIGLILLAYGLIKSRLKLATLIICAWLTWLLFFSSLSIFSNYYPYYGPLFESKYSETLMARSMNYEEYLSNFHRARVDKLLALPKKALSLFSPKAPVENVLVSEKGATRSADKKENRENMISEFYTFIKQKPLLGFYPDLYSNKTNVLCNEEQRCSYPHNLVIETIYYFGLFVGGIYLFFLLALIINSVKTLACLELNLQSLVSLSFIHFFLYSQFSGTYYDHLAILIILIISLAYAPNVVEDANDSTYKAT